jgi:hypothetical protein
VAAVVHVEGEVAADSLAGGRERGVVDAALASLGKSLCIKARPSNRE